MFYRLIQKAINRKWVPYFIISFLILVVFLPTLFYGITKADDHILVVYNHEFNKELKNVPQAFREDIFRAPEGNGFFYRPILRLSFMLDAQINHQNIILVSHATNILLHLVVTLLLFYLLKKLDIKNEVAFWLALLFAVHPLVSHTVAWIPGRNDSLLAVFLLISILFFIKFSKTNKLLFFIANIFFLTLALLTKETALIMPIFLIGLYYILKKRQGFLLKSRELLFVLVAWTEVVFIWFFLRYTAIGGFVGSAETNVLSSIFNNLYSIVPTIGKVLIPVNLSTTPILENINPVYGIISVLIISIILVLSKKKENELVLFGFFWFFCFIILSLAKPYSHIKPDFLENRIYVPMMGFLFFYAGLYQATIIFINNKKVLINKIFVPTVLVLIIIFTPITIYRNNFYQNEFSFWENAITHSPDHAWAHANLGVAYYTKGYFDEAKSSLRRAIELNERERFVNNFLGLIYINEENYDKATYYLEREIELIKYYPEAYINLGIIAMKQGNINQAKEYWNKANEIDIYKNGSYFKSINYFYHKKNKEDFINYLKLMQQEGVDMPKGITNKLKN